jgi:alpha-mannosidase
MMNLTGNDWQFGQGGWNEWTFRYRIVLLNDNFDPLRAVEEAQQFAEPPFLQVPRHPPAVPGLKALDINFSGGPLLAFKVAEDNRRLILRFWNVLDGITQGSLKLPAGWSRAEICDALERPVKPLRAAESVIRFTADPLEILTVALTKDN